MITPRQLAVLAALCGTVALAGWYADKFGFRSFIVSDTATPIGDGDVTTGAISSSAEAGSFDASRTTVTGSPGDAASSVPNATESKVTAVSAAENPSVEVPVLHSAPTSPPPEASVRLVSAFPSKATDDDPLPPVRPLEASGECLETASCIDDYLWSLYERTPKVDTNKVIEKIKKAVKKDGKVRTIIKTITNYVVGDFTWKDPAAAQKADKSTKEYVIGGMDPKFKLKLYRALRTIEAAGFMPGITSAFRDDYRQSIAEGNKAASDSSYHGGSRRGGFGRGLAADLVSLKGETRRERLASSDTLWKWIDAHENELGIGRPYRDRDPPHVGPIDGKEFADKRGAASAQKTAAKAKTVKSATAKATTTGKTAKTAKTATAKTAQPAKTAKAETKKPGPTKHAPPEKSSKVSSLQTSTTVER